MRVGAGAILGVIISGIVLGAGSVIFENSKATEVNRIKIESMTKSFDKYEARIMKRFDKLEEKLNGN